VSSRKRGGGLGGEGGRSSPRYNSLNEWWKRYECGEVNPFPPPHLRQVSASSRVESRYRATKGCRRAGISCSLSTTIRAEIVCTQSLARIRESVISRDTIREIFARWLDTASYLRKSSLREARAAANAELRRGRIFDAVIVFKDSGIYRHGCLRGYITLCSVTRTYKLLLFFCKFFFLHF